MATDSKPSLDAQLVVSGYSGIVLPSAHGSPRASHRLAWQWSTSSSTLTGSATWTHVCDRALRALHTA